MNSESKQNHIPEATESSLAYLVSTSLVSLVGIGLSAYSTLHHLELKRNGLTNFSCNINDQMSCDAVAASQYSEVLGAPLGIWGIAFFLSCFALVVLGRISPKNSKASLQSFVVMAAAGCLGSAVLAYLSFFVIQKLCVVCIGIYVCTILLAGLAFAFRSLIPRPFSFNLLGNGLSVGLLITVLAVSGFRLWASSNPNPVPPSEPAAPIATNESPTNFQKPVEIHVSRSIYSGKGEDFRKGNENAKVIFVEFADFQCPACKQGSEIFTALHKEFGNRVLFVFKNYPLDKSCNSSVQAQIHQYACLAATLGRCAGEKGKFWEFYNMAFERQNQMNDETLKSWAKEIGLSNSEIDSCIKSKDISEKIADDVAQGNAAGVDSTPTFYLNGRKVLGERSVERFRVEIERALNR